MKLIAFTKILHSSDLSNINDDARDGLLSFFIKKKTMKIELGPYIVLLYAKIITKLGFFKNTRSPITISLKRNIYFGKNNIVVYISNWKH